MPDLKLHDRIGIAALLRQLTGRIERGEVTPDEVADRLKTWATTLERNEKAPRHE